MPPVPWQVPHIAEVGTCSEIWAPSRVLKLRSKVPTFVSFPEAAM